MQFTTEVMPTEIRGQGFALVNTLSMLSQILSPYIVYSSVISAGAPFIILGLTGICAAVPSLFLPETAGVALPDTIHQMEHFGKDDRFFWIPLLGESKRLKTRTKHNGKSEWETF